MAGWITEWWVRLAIGFIGSGVIALAACKLRSLSISGAWSAVAMGTGYVTLGGPVWFGTLLAFFISSTLWSKWKRRHRQKRNAESKYAKGGRRDAGQVWANGGLGLALCALHSLWPEPGLLFAFIGVMASANADTWATEIGALSRTAPISVLGGKPVTPGTSGGVTPLGSAAALAGAVFIGAAAALLEAAAPSSAAAALASAAGEQYSAASASTAGVLLAAASASTAGGLLAATTASIAGGLLAATTASTAGGLLAAASVTPSGVLLAAATALPSGGLYTAAFPVALAAAATVAGVAGAFADSLIGATLQAMYRCRVCGCETERVEHCGVSAERLRGFAWMTNDKVNLLSSAAAGLLAWAIGTALA